MTTSTVMKRASLVLPMQRVRVQDIVSQEGEDEARTCPRARAEAEEVRQARKAALVTAAERKMRSALFAFFFSE